MIGLSTGRFLVLFDDNDLAVKRLICDVSPEKNFSSRIVLALS